MASPDPPQPPGSPPDAPSDGVTLEFQAGERIRWLVYTGTVIHHRGVPYVLFDHLRDPQRAAYAITKLQRISPVQAVVTTDESTSPPALPAGD